MMLSSFSWLLPNHRQLVVLFSATLSKTLDILMLIINSLLHNYLFYYTTAMSIDFMELELMSINLTSITSGQGASYLPLSLNVK